MQLSNDLTTSELVGTYEFDVRMVGKFFYVWQQHYRGSILGSISGLEANCKKVAVFTLTTTIPGSNFINTLTAMCRNLIYPVRFRKFKEGVFPTFVLLRGSFCKIQIF